MGIIIIQQHQRKFLKNSNYRRFYWSFLLFLTSLKISKNKTLIQIHEKKSSLSLTTDFSVTLLSQKNNCYTFPFLCVSMQVPVLFCLDVINDLIK